VIFAIGVVLAFAAAVRSTWSPCGLSMLSQITPIAETGRGNRFGRTAAWFIAGAVLGGATLGAAMAVGAAGTRALGVPAESALVVIAIVALITAALDARALGVAPPFLRRQVNEDWLVNYRSWVYGTGFGWQIGVGIATYIMTAAVFLMIAVGVLGGSPWLAAVIAVTFGIVRGLSVLIGAPLRTNAALLAFHRRFEAWSEPVRRAVIAVQLLVTVFAAGIGGGFVVAIVVAIPSGAVAMFALQGDRRPRRAEPKRTPAAPGTEA
jgi:hypothetical protein